MYGGPTRKAGDSPNIVSQLLSLALMVLRHRPFLWWNDNRHLQRQKVRTDWSAGVTSASVIQVNVDAVSQWCIKVPSGVSGHKTHN